MPTKNTTLLLVDDHPIVRAGLRHLLESMMKISDVTEADNGDLGYQLFQKHKPDVVIIDLNMPCGIDGFETIRRIKTNSHDARILVCSMHTNTALIRRTLELGATGYITKNCVAKNMLQATLSVREGIPYIDPTLASNMIADSIKGETSNKPLDLLTNREFQIFKLVAEGKSSDKIAKLISISPKTVRVHLCRIMVKLKLQNKTQLVFLAIRCGILQKDCHHYT